MATVVFGDFEWDADNAERNLVKHGVSFEEATSVFLDIDYMLLIDPDQPERFIALGVSRFTRVLFVVHCERGERVRVISARRATRNERTEYGRRKETE